MNATTRRNFKPLGPLAIIVALGLVSAALAAKGGNKGKPQPPEEPVLPDVRYVLTWLDLGIGWEMRAVDMNDSGGVVGYAFDPADSANRLAFVHTASTGTQDLNGIPNAVWIDLDADENALPATGWIAETARGINELGQIVGTALHDVTLARRAFLLVDLGGVTPQFLLLPQVGVGENKGAALNDNGLVVGYGSGTTFLYTPIAEWPWYTGEDLGFNCDTVADINNAGVIVTRVGFRYTPGEPVDYFPGHWFYGINDGIDENSAMISGSRERTRGKNGQEGGAIRLFELDNQEEVLYSGSLFTIGKGINDAGDVCIGTGNRGFVYTDMTNDAGEKFGALALDDLVLNQDDDWLDSQIHPWAINNPDSTGFGQICGETAPYATGGFRRAFLLTPVLLP